MLGDAALARRLTWRARLAGRAHVRAERARMKAMARRARRVSKARRRLPPQVVVAGGAGTWVAVGDPAWPVGAVGFVAVLAAVRSVAVLCSPQPAPVPALPPVPPVPAPPPRTSAAWPAVRRLEAVREELSALLPLVAPPGRGVAEEAWQAAAEADAALRWQAARFAAVERHGPPDADLLPMLLDGVANQERLVVAVADLVSASAAPIGTARLQDAADRLHGLAQGLREVG